MSLRLEMLQMARSAPSLLREGGDGVVTFLQEQFNADGGGKNRSGASDLYYTVFALEGLLAMEADPPLASVAAFLQGFGDGDGLDLVHLCCLGRCWADLPVGSPDAGAADSMLKRIASYRSGDGGFGSDPQSERGTVYHCFLALGAYQDLGRELPNPEGLGRCLQGLQTSDGAYANDHDLTVGTTPAAAAAATIMRHVGLPVPPALGDWLMARCCETGGFTAMPFAPSPDLLSTATALHALAGMGVSLDRIREPCLDFLDGLWVGRGFLGHQADDAPDSEYTYYALLALGHLAPG